MNKLFLIGWLTLVTFLACENDKRHSVRLLEAERLVDTRPDSALLLLERMGDPAGWPAGKKQAAPIRNGQNLPGGGRAFSRSAAPGGGKKGAKKQTTRKWSKKRYKNKRLSRKRNQIPLSLKNKDSFLKRNISVFRRSVGFAIENRIVRLVLFENVVDCSQ